MRHAAYGLLALLLIAGCTTGGDVPDEVDRDYRIGTRGLELDFLQNSPPDTAYVGDSLNILVEVRNDGAYPTTDSFDGKLEIYGYDEKAFIGERWDDGPWLTPDLQGRSQFNPQGGREVKQYIVDEVTTLFGSEFYRPTIVVAACYKYQTIAEELVCIDPEPYSVLDEDKVCDLTNGRRTYGLGSQGAPVAVTRVEQETSANSIHFGIHISNVGGGRVIDENVIDECPLELDFNDVDRVLVDARLPFDASPRCQPRGDHSDPVRLDESGDGFIYCSFQKPASRSAFETTLQVQLDYRYYDSIEKRMEIVNLDR